MKKLLIALTAVATGLFASTAVADAEALPTGVGFESLMAGDELMTAGDGYWTASADPEAKMTVTAWNGEFPADITRPAVPGEDNEVNYLSVKTKFGNPLIRRAFTAGAPTVTNGKIFFDSMVKFTATDEDPTTEYENAKLIVYVKDNSEDDTTPATTTNLMVKAQNGTYDLGTIDVDVWHRLTIKAVKAFTSGDELAFTVYVDETPKAATSAAFTDTSSLTTEAKGINAAKRLFPAINACTSITEVGFDGQGFIDDLVFADTVDGEWANENAFAITMGDNIESYTWTSKSAGVVVDSATATGAASIPAVANMTVEISNVVFAEGNWELAADNLEGGITFANNTFSGFGIGSSAATLIAEDKTPRVSVTIGAEAVTYPTLAKAFEAINALGSGDVVVKFDKNYFTDGKVKVGTYLVEEVLYNEAVISSGADVTIDLAGCTIEGPDDYEGPVLAFQSNVTIVDTVGGGKVVPVEGNTAAVMYLANLAIAKGTFDGAFVTGDGVDMPIGTITAITGGSFDYATNSDGGEFAFKDVLTADYVVAKDNETEPKYWVVSPAPKAGVVVETTHATVSGVKSGDQLAAGAKINFTVEADTNYTLKSVMIGDEEQGATGSYEYEVTADDVKAGKLNITAVAAATEWTITYYNDDDLLNPTVFAEETYSVEEGTLNSGAKQGYTFNGWSDEEGNAVTTLEGKTGDLELFGSWTIDQAFGGGTGDVADPYVITTEAHLVELQTKVAAGDTFEGKYFKQTANIDFVDEEPWKGIGNKAGTLYFGGIYDGNNKRIDNVTFDAQGGSSNSYLGFFRYVKNGTVKDLTIESDGFGNVPEFFGADTEYGGAVIVGIAENATLSGLTAEGNIGTETDPTTHNAGGIAVEVIATTVENCVNKAALHCAYSKAAGIVVFANPSKSYTYGTAISGCSNQGAIVGYQCWTNTSGRCESDAAGASKYKGVASDGFAGILAWVGDSTRAVALTNNVNTGSITADGGYIGGIIGKISNPITGEGNSCAAALPIVGTFFAAQGTDFWYESIVNDIATQDKTALAVGQTRVIAAGSGNSNANLPKPVLGLALNEEITFITNLCATALNFSGITAADGSANEIKAEVVPNGVKFTCVALPPPGPTPVDDGKVEPDPEDPTGKTFVVTPADGKDSIEITGADSSMTIKVTSAADFTITGLNGAAVKVVAGGQEITAYVKGGDPYSTALDDVKVKAVVDDREGVDTPFAIGETSDVTIKAIPGLTYTLKVAGAVDGDYGTADGDDAVKTAGAADTTITLKDATPPEGAGFYKINIAK